jgi:hypothetical protein
MRVENTMQDKIKNLIKRIEEAMIPYSLNVKLTYDLENFLEGKPINYQWIANLFLLKSVHWRIIGEVMAVMKLEKLDISSCSFSSFNPCSADKMDWDGFVQMLRKSYISQLQVSCDFPYEHVKLTDLLNILRANKAKALAAQSDNLKHKTACLIAGFDFFNRNMLPKELIEFVEEKKAIVDKTATLKSWW